VNEIKKAPGRRMIVIDPRRTEVADVADVHLALRPGTDAFLLAAILAIILKRGGEAAEFLSRHTVGWETFGPCSPARRSRRGWRTPGSRSPTSSAWST
jgi:anaerobic selenocysteine-containing dehydrogenase